MPAARPSPPPPYRRKREIEGWSDFNLCFYYDAQKGAAGRELIREHEWYYSSDAVAAGYAAAGVPGYSSGRGGYGGQGGYGGGYSAGAGRTPPRTPKFNVLLTTYEVALADALELSELRWRYVVVDEVRDAAFAQT
jgi:hypothetical protein